MNIRKVEAVARIRDKQPRPTKEELEARIRHEFEKLAKEKKR